ncbi:MAG: cyclic nucleotide-binding domain-containing protein [Alphaproteobacteria bacterium]|nr:cyclic nucleotide-binding domain-containing protein [Alphaproteobacteria bacterium]
MSADQAYSLADIELLAELPKESLQALEKRCSWRNFSAQEQIIDRQSTSRDIYFIVTGRVRVVNFSLSGREVAFDEIPAGAYFGETAAIDGDPRSATVVSLGDTTVAIMSPETFHSLLIEHPKVAFSLMVRMATIIRTSNERIMDLSTLGANNRVYAEILRLAKDDVSDSNTAKIRPIPIHGDIASRVSTTRETVARVLNDLARKGLVKREKDALHILDMTHLSEMVEQFQME